MLEPVNHNEDLRQERSERAGSEIGLFDGPGLVDGRQASRRTLDPQPEHHASGTPRVKRRNGSVMSVRPSIVLRDADREDAAALIHLWSSSAATSRDEGQDAPAASSLWRQPGVAEAAAALDLNLAHPDKRIIVALIEGEIVGALMCDITTTTPINLTRVLIVTELQVLPTFRRKSVASTLLSGAANYGEEFNCEVVATFAPAHAREPNRFLTKLGFSQVSVVRVAQASMLRSKLSSKATNSRDTGKMIAVRRTLRRRQLESRKLRPRP